MMANSPIWGFKKHASDAEKCGKIKVAIENRVLDSL